MLKAPDEGDRAKTPRPGEDAIGAVKRRPYQTPVLSEHGDLESLTAAKMSNRFDGGGKPRTRASGFNG